MSKTPLRPIVPFIPRCKVRGKRLQRAVLSYIEANPKHWHQASWHCGTAYCFAGIASCMCGIRPPPSPDNISTFWSSAQHQAWINKVSKALGVDPFMGGGLFNAINTLDDLRRVVGGA